MGALLRVLVMLLGGVLRCVLAGHAVRGMAAGVWIGAREVKHRSRGRGNNDGSKSSTRSEHQLTPALSSTIQCMSTGECTLRGHLRVVARTAPPNELTGTKAAARCRGMMVSRARRAASIFIVQ